MCCAGDADVAVLAHPVQALGHGPGAGDLGLGGLGEVLDHGEVSLGLEAATDADHPGGCAEVDLRRSRRLGLDHLHAQRGGGDLLDGRAAPLAGGTEPPSSTRATGPETATVSSAMSPKTALTTMTSPPSIETERAPVRTGACSRAAAAPSSTRSLGLTAAEHDAGRIGRDGVGNRRGVGLHGRVTRLAEPEDLVHAARRHRLGHGPRSGDDGRDWPTQGARDRDQVADRRLIPDDDPGVHAHCRALSVVLRACHSAPEPRRAVTSSLAAAAGSVVSKI